MLDAQLPPDLLPVGRLRPPHLQAPPPALVAQKAVVALGTAMHLRGQSAMGQTISKRVSNGLSSQQWVSNGLGSQQWVRNGLGSQQWASNGLGSEQWLRQSAMGEAVSNGFSCMVTRMDAAAWCGCL